MDEDETAGAPDQASLFPKTAGDRLREAREAQGLTLQDVANRTRVPIRHLEAIENNRLEGLASPTYAIGFAKTYARAVGLDEKAIAAEMRQSPQMPLSPRVGFEEYEPADPRRVPSSGIATIAAIIAVILLIGVGIWYGTSWLRGGEEPAALATPDAEASVAAAPEATPTPIAGGQVVLTATDSVWLRVYDATGKTLIEKTMQPGEQYSLPGDANNPMINIGRPDKLQVTINGSAVPPLGDGKRAIKDVPISAAALQARGTAPAAAATPPASAPAAGNVPAAPAAPAHAPSAKKTDIPVFFQDRPAATPTPKASSTPKAVPTPDPVSLPTSAPTPAP